MRRPPGTLIRNTTAARINHWITAGCFVLLLLSGLSMFHPMLFWLSGLFGGGQSTRTIHPWIGTVLLLSYAVFHNEDSVFIFAYAFTWIPYIRNLIIHHRHAEAHLNCSSCGKPSPPQANFCSSCGTRLAEAEAKAERG